LRQCTGATHQRHHIQQVKAVNFGTIAQCIDIGVRGFKLTIYFNPAIDLDPRRRGHIDARAQADGRHHHIARHDTTIGQMRLQPGVSALQAGQHRAQVKARAQAFQTGLHRRGSSRVQQGGHHLLAGRDQVDLVAACDQVIGEFAADQPGPKD